MLSSLFSVVPKFRPSSLGPELMAGGTLLDSSKLLAASDESWPADENVNPVVVKRVRIPNQPSSSPHTHYWRCFIVVSLSLFLVLFCIRLVVVE